MDDISKREAFEQGKAEGRRKFEERHPPKFTPTTPVYSDTPVEPEWKQGIQDYVPKSEETQVIFPRYVEPVNEVAEIPEPYAPAQGFATIATGLILYPLLGVIFVLIVTGGIKTFMWIVGL